jgi:hypothetical protein
MAIQHDTVEIGRSLILEQPVIEPLGYARRQARMTLIVLWLACALSLVLVSSDLALPVVILIAGLSTVLESQHGALAFARTVAPLWRRSALGKNRNRV